MRVDRKKVILVFLIFILEAAIAVAVPYGPRSVTVEQSDRKTEFNDSVATVQAQAGNVTQLRINVTMSTKRWQGYYGNITGLVTLQDASGYRMYEWGNDVGVSVVGEVYAANYTVSDWSKVYCVNLSGPGNSTFGPNTTILEDMYGANPNDKDGIDETFTTYMNVTIGSTTLLNCPATRTYNGSGAENSIHWNETLLWENHSSGLNTVVYTAFVEQNENGFNNKTWDFQMIVGEDGDTSGTATYYFYVELV